MSIDFTNTMKNKTAYLTIQEINKMLKYTYEREEYRDYVLLLTLARTGRRVTEIVGEKPWRKAGLRPMDIHDDLIEFDILKKNHIKIKSSKTGQMFDKEKIKRMRTQKMPKRKLVAVDSEYMYILKWYIEDKGIRPRDRVFPLTRQRVDVIIKKIATACGIVRPNFKIHAHMFRHSMAINLMKDNPNDAGIIKIVQNQLDHSDIGVTYHYAQFTQEDQKEKLNKLFNKGE